MTLAILGWLSIQRSMHLDIGDPLVELRSTRLFAHLSELGADYAERALAFLERVAPILATTASHFPYYTRHDAHHGFRVLRRVEQVVASECIGGDGPLRLGAVEVYLLILAAYAHDLGMTVFPGEADLLLKELQIDWALGWETDPKLQSYLRREHSIRGGRYIREQSDALQVPVNLLDALDRIMRAHNLSINELEGEIPDGYAAGERLIDVRQLAIIVCVADALEFSDTRVVEGVLSAIEADPSPAARHSYLENMKHVCVGDSLAVDDNGRVTVSGTFDEAEVLALAHRTLDEMEGWIAGYCDLDRRMMVPRLRVRPEAFARNLAFPRGRFERLGVRLNKRNVIDLIASNAVWRESGPVLRELLQNAIEACRYRRHHSSDSDAYAPAVSVTFDRQHREIVVEDNGCGMTERVILNNLLTVGSSRSSEPGYSTARYAPIARFGVGFWSVFTLAETAHVETASFESHRGDPEGAAAASGTAFDVSLDEPKEYTVFLPVTRRCGTIVRLKLKSEVSIDETFTSACAQILCSDVPVTLHLDDEEVAVPMAVPDIPHRELVGSRDRVLDQHGIKLFEWRSSFGSTELSLLLAYRMENDKPTFLLNPTNSVLNAFGHLHHSRTTVCGFHTPVRERHICFDLGRVGLYFANRTTPRGINYSLDRRQLVAGAASAEFAHEVTRLIHDGYRAFLDATNGRDLATVAALREQAAMHGGNVYDQYTGDELAVAAERFPDLMPFKFHPLSGGDPIYARADELHTLKGKVFFMQERPMIKVDEGTFIPMEIEGGRGVATLRGMLADLSSSGEPIYVMEADRSASMLFDADPDGSIIQISVGPFGRVTIQCVQLERLNSRKPGQVLDEVRGPWSGTIYVREFEVLTAKPYVFLGRHRVLVKRGSKLAVHFEGLASEGRRARLAKLVADLGEDQNGYTPPSVVDLLNP